MFRYLRRQWFLASLTIVFCVGFFWSDWFESFTNAQILRSAIVAVVIFMMALPLDTQSVGQSLRRPWAALLGSAVNMVLLPLAAWAMSYLLAGDMRTGLLITAAVPCTLATAAVWTRRAGGDDTVSILVTALTNISCFLTTPFWLFATTGSQLTPELQGRLARMPIRLALLVVLPMALAQLVRQNRDIGNWATARKSMLGTVSQMGILSMVLAGATKCGLALSGTSWSNINDFPLMFAVVVVLHLLLFWFGMWLARMLGFHRPQQIAVGMSGSQKTLMVGLHISIQYFGGLTILPMMTYHLTQLTADTVIADWLRATPAGGRGSRRAR
jgi:sodium/bile acid cotransporter 7